MSKYTAFFLPAIVNYLAYFLWSHGKGNITFAYATLAFIFIAIPLIDLVAIKRRSGTTAQSATRSFADTAIPVLSLPVQIFNIFFFAWFIGSHDLPIHEIAITVLTAGILSALYAQNPAHELIHHGTRFERAVGIMLFSTSIYSGAKLAHLYSHHVLAATDDDPTSANYGKSLYAFLPAAIAVNLFGWWGPKTKNTNGIVSRGYKVMLENLTGYTLSLGWGLMIFFLFGGKSLLLFIVQSFIGILVLEMMNYIGHYGLERKIDASGKCEAISERHAWDCDMPFSNLVLISVQKHADHHINPNKSYDELRCVENSPRLPLSYPMLFLLTLVPPLWRLVIHPRLDTYRSQWLVAGKQ